MTTSTPEAIERWQYRMGIARHKRHLLLFLLAILARAGVLIGLPAACTRIGNWQAIDAIRYRF
jgi:hypothetical protein